MTSLPDNIKQDKRVGLQGGKWPTGKNDRFLNVIWYSEDMWHGPERPC